MKSNSATSSSHRTYPRRKVIGAGLGTASLVASGVLATQQNALGYRQTPATTLPADAASEQVLRIQTGSGGAGEFRFQPLSGGDAMEYWVSLWFLPPMYFDVNLEIQPLIFESWTSNEDSTVWTFKIDGRAQWSDGTPITASQVKGSWEIMADPLAENTRIADYMKDVEGFDQVLSLAETEASGLVVVDDNTLEVRLVASDPVFHWRVATIHMAPVKVEEARDDIGFFWRPENNPACSGPYLLEQWDPDGGTATMGKNPNWWLGEGQYLDRIEFLNVNDQGTIALMVQNEEVDIIHPDRVMPPEMEAEYPGLFRPVVNFGYDSFWLSASAEPTNDINVRKALILSVNQEDVFRAAFPQGAGIPLDQLLDPELPCRDEPGNWYTYDPDAARAALAESSYGSADNLPTLRVTPRGERPELNRALEAVIEFWRQNLGISNVIFETQPEGFGPDEDRINLIRDDVLVRFPDSATYMFVAAYSTSDIPSARMNGYANPEVDALIDEALQTPADDPQRCDLALEAQRLFRDDYHAIVFGDEAATLNSREYVVGYERGPDRSFIEPWKVYLATH
jgi:peptide/nickel transport system substrate-binding protein